MHRAIGLNWVELILGVTVNVNAMESAYLDCIEACRKCIADCQYCLLQMSGRESKNDCPLCCILCIESCSAALQFLLADSQYAKEYCSICAKVCQWCAEQCAQHDHKHCEDCANSCVKCMEECQKVVMMFSDEI